MMIPPFCQKRNKSQPNAQYKRLIILGGLILGLSFGKAPSALASTVNLRITNDGQVVDALKPDTTIGELYRGWSKNVLFVPLTTSPLPDNFTVTIASDNNNLNLINPNIYAIHGDLATLIDQSPTSRTWSVNTFPGGQVTIVASVPHGIFKAPFLWKIIALLSKIPDKVWLLSGFAVPLLLFLALLIRHWLISRHQVILPRLNPALLSASPAALTVLLRGFVSRRASAATLVDLAHRGHIQMLIRSDKIVLYKRGGKDSLRQHEEAMLERWFKTDWNSRDTDLSREIKTQIINDQSTTTNLSIYREVESYGWFTPPPLITHWKLLVTAFLLTITSSLLFIVIFVTLPSATSLLWFFGGILASVAILYAWAPSIARLNQTGQSALSMLLATRSLLFQKNPIESELFHEMMWEQWLAMAIVCGDAAGWLQRWRHLPFQQPSWLLTPDPIRDFDEFLTQLKPVLKLASESIRDTILPAYV